MVPDASTRVETPLSLRSVLDRLPTGLRVYTATDDPLRRSWEEFVLPHVDPFDRDHYETVWNAVVRRGPHTRSRLERDETVGSSDNSDPTAGRTTVPAVRSYGIRPDVDEKIRELVELAGDAPNQDLIFELITTVLKLYRDKASRGDLKLVNTALKEMRYSILVFARHFDPKVTIFGSARIPAGDPNYELAEEVAELMAGKGWGVITGAGPGVMEAGSKGAGKRTRLRRQHPPAVRTRLQLVHRSRHEPSTTSTSSPAS